MSVESIIVEHELSATPDVVWQAITSGEQMRQWFFEPMTDFQPRVGFETQFNVHCDDVDYLHCWKVTDVVDGERIAYDWRYEGIAGESVVTWELAPSPAGTRLKLTHAGIETFPQDDPIFSRESGQAGWEYFLQDSLPAFLDRQRT